MATTQPEEPMYLILKAQQANIARIASDLVLPGTDGQGNNIKLWGPQPTVIRLYDTPTRFVNATAMENWERIITLSPIEDTVAARVFQRNDRTFQYVVQFLTRLLDSEIDADRAEAVTDGVKASNPLAVKAHRLVYDWHHVFHDDLLLETAGCPQGLIDDAGYTLQWDPGVEYPYALFIATVVGQRSAW